MTDHKGNSTSLFATKHYFAGKARNLNSLTERLFEIFEGPLASAAYSYRDGSYRAF